MYTLKELVKFRLEYGSVSLSVAKESHEYAENWNVVKWIAWVVGAICFSCDIGTFLSGSFAVAWSLLVASLFCWSFVLIARKRANHYKMAESVYDQEKDLSKMLKGIE